jgi:hypothetical protein
LLPGAAAHCTAFNKDWLAAGGLSSPGSKRWIGQFHGRLGQAEAAHSTVTESYFETNQQQYHPYCKAEACIVAELLLPVAPLCSRLLQCMMQGFCWSQYTGNSHFLVTTLWVPSSSQFQANFKLTLCQCTYKEGLLEVPHGDDATCAAIIIPAYRTANNIVVYRWQR